MNVVAWEFNFRGELDFLHQVLSQKEGRDLTVENGWLYFVHDWTQINCQVLLIDPTPELLQCLEAVVAKVLK